MKSLCRWLAVAVLLSAGPWVMADIEHCGYEFMDAPAAAEMGDVGVFANYTFQADNLQRNARIYVPQNYDPQRPVGVLFGFHGYLTDLSVEGHYEALWDLEPYADDEYFITVALLLPYNPELGGWRYGWDHERNGLANHDVSAVYEMLETLRKNYNIDENRIYATGHSNGAGFCHTVVVNLPGVFAAVAPEAPVMGSYPATLENPFASIAWGGTLDDFSTDDRVRQMNADLGDQPLEADFYVFDRGHDPPGDDDLNVDPPLLHNEKILEFLREHPKFYQTQGYTPKASAEPFSETYDDPDMLPSSTRWRVETFEVSGILTDLAGQQFKTADGQLANWPIGEGVQGGLCRTAGFFTQPKLTFETNFQVQFAETNFLVTPIWTQDSHGRVRALMLTRGHWQWQAFGTQRQWRQAWHMDQAPRTLGLQALPQEMVVEGAFRVLLGRSAARGRPVTQADEPRMTLGGATISGGEMTLAENQTYQARVERDGRVLRLSLANQWLEPVADGWIELPDDEPMRFGVGMTGDKSLVSFDDVAVRVD